MVISTLSITAPVIVAFLRVFIVVVTLSNLSLFKELLPIVPTDSGCDDKIEEEEVNGVDIPNRIMMKM